MCWKNISDNCLSGLQRALGNELALFRCYTLALASVASDRSLLLREFYWRCWDQPIYAVQITGLRPQILGWDRLAYAYLYVLQVIVVTTDHKI